MGSGGRKQLISKNHVIMTQAAFSGISASQSVSHPAASKDIIGNAHKIAIIGLKFHRVSLLSKSLNTMGPVVAPHAQTAKQSGRLIGGAHS